MWTNGNTPRVGDWLYAPAEILSGYSDPSRISEIKHSNAYKNGLTYCPGQPSSGLGIDQDNLRHFKWYRPSNKITIIIRGK